MIVKGMVSERKGRTTSEQAKTDSLLKNEQPRTLSAIPTKKGEHRRVPALASNKILMVLAHCRRELERRFRNRPHLVRCVSPADKYFCAGGRFRPHCELTFRLRGRHGDVLWRVSSSNDDHRTICVFISGYGKLPERSNPGEQESQFCFHNDPRFAVQSSHRRLPTI